MTSTAFITHRDCWLHDMGEHAPRVSRAAVGDQRSPDRSGLDMYLSFHDAPLASVEQISRVHPAEHVEDLLASVPEHGIRHLDPDTAMSPNTMKAALRSPVPGSTPPTW
jgi:acetoin utilization deacetylase AcuC-like enzyme